MGVSCREILSERSLPVEKGAQLARGLYDADARARFAREMGLDPKLQPARELYDADASAG
jgi:hypothetical protein